MLLDLSRPYSLHGNTIMPFVFLADYPVYRWAQVNGYAGLILMLWIITPILYFTNYWNAQRYGIVSSTSYTEQGAPYPLEKILTPELTLDTTKYEEQGPLRLSTYFAVNYGISFLSLTATVTHVALWYGRDIFGQMWKNTGVFKGDIHAKMMKVYPEVRGCSPNAN
jgi:hypothetical protein